MVIDFNLKPVKIFYKRSPKISPRGSEISGSIGINNCDTMDGEDDGSKEINP